MANHASALKRHRQNEKRRMRNASVKSNLKTAVKKVKDAMAAGKAEEAKAGLKKAAEQLDGAVSKGVLHRNNASRKISNLTLQVNSLSSK